MGESIVKDIWRTIRALNRAYSTTSLIGLK